MSPPPVGVPPHAVRITEPDDPRIAIFRDVKERDRVGRDGIFIAEGNTVLTVLLTRSRLSVVAVLVEEGRAARMPLLSAARARPLYVAPQSVLDRIAGFHLHRGILGAGRIPASPDLADVLPDGPVRLPVLVSISNHDNVGGIYRNAAAFEAAAVAVDATSADPFYRKAIRVGAAAPLVVPTVRIADVVSTLAALRNANVTPYALTPGAGAELGKTPLCARAAFVLGNEGHGLADAVIAAAEPLRVAIAPEWDSLNVATASAIALHAHRQQWGGGG